MSPSAEPAGSGDSPGPAADPDRLTAAKAQWRTRLLAGRATRSEADRAVASRALRAHVLAIVADSGWATVSSYVPFGDEPGSIETLELLHAAGVRVLLPRTGRHDLTWAAYDSQLLPGRLDIMEPTGADLGVGALSTVDAVLAPALAVDRNGIRIGYGRGYYDRALAPLPSDRPVLAIVYDDELVDSLPAADYDRPVTHTISPLLGTRPITVPARAD